MVRFLRVGPVDKAPDRAAASGDTPPGRCRRRKSNRGPPWPSISFRSGPAFSPCGVHVRAAGRLRSRRRHSVAIRAGRCEPRPDDGFGRPIWDGNRDLAGHGRNRAAGGFSDGFRHHHPGGVFPDPVHADRACCSRRRVRVSPHVHAQALLELVVPSWDRWSRPSRKGIVLGTYVQGIPVDGRHFSGGSFEWATPFAVLTGVGLIAATASSAPAGW